MPENSAKSSPSEDPEVLRGKIVAIEESRIRVRLESGRIGFAEPAEEAGMLVVGHEATFRLVADQTTESPILAFVSRCVAPEPAQSYEQEIARLHHALSGRRPTHTVGSVERVHLGEEQIREWMARVDECVDALRKNRAKRLDEQFYNSS